MVATFEQLRAKRPKPFEELRREPFDQDRNAFFEDVYADPERLKGFLPVDEEQSLNRLLEVTQQTPEEVTDLMFFSEQFGQLPERIRPYIKDIIKYTGDFTPSKATQQERGIFSKIAESWRRGDAEISADIASYEALYEGRGSYDEVRKIRKKLQLQEALDPIEGNFFGEMVYGSARIIPGMQKGYWSAIEEAFEGMAIGTAMALAAGQIPPLTLAPEEIVGLPAGALIGTKAGLMIGASMFWYKQGAGAMASAMIEKGYDPHVSMEVAGIAAIPYAMVEMLQVWQLTPGLRRSMLKTTQKRTLEVMARVAARYGGTLTKEVLEEVIQEIIQIGAEDISGALSKIGIKVDAEYFAERGRRVWETLKEAGKSMALLPIPGAAIDMYSGLRTVKAVEVPLEVVEKPPEAPPVAEVPVEVVEVPPKPPEVKPPSIAEIEEVSPIVEPELTKQEQANIAKLEAEIEEPFVMERVKDVGFVIKEKATGKEVAVIAKRKAAKIKLAEFIKGERKVRITKRVPKVLRDTATVDKLITEAHALKEGMKKAAQAARKAYAVGKAEGIAKVKTHYLELKAREKARQELKSRITKAVKVITKEVPKSVDFHYREAIEQLKAGIDPSLRTVKTLREREKTREYLARKPEVLKDMPVKLLKKLAKKSIGEYTVAEVEQIAQEIERLAKQGKLKRSLRLKQKARKLEKDIQDLAEAISKGEKIKFESEPITYESTKQGFIKTVFEKTKAWTWRPSRIFDMLDGMRDFAGKAHRIFIDQVNNATNAKLRQVDKRKDAGKAKMKELGITFRDLSQVREIVGIRYMVDEMIGVYCANKNRLGKLALMYGNNLNEKTISEVIANLTEAEKAWGDFIIAEYETRYDVLREKVIEVENRDMGYEESYTPIRRMEVDYSTHTEEVIDAILQREHLRRSWAEHGFTIHRKVVPAEFQKPIRLNVTGVWLAQIDKQEQYIHFAELIRDLHKIVADKEFRVAVEKQFGTEFNKVIKNYIDRTANPNIYKSYNGIENVSRTLRQHTAIAYLAYNLVTMIKQIPSVLLYLPDSGATHFISSAMQFVENPMKMIEMVQEKDPQVKHRAIERELEELKVRQPRLYGRIVSAFGKAGMKGIYLFDSVARTIGWNAVYEKALKSDKSEAESVRLAQNSTLRTQPAAAAKDVAQLYATNEVYNWFTMFTNQLNQIYNIATYDISGYLKNEEYARFAASFMGMSLVALTIWTITHRRTPETPEEYVDAAAEQAINAIPLFGKSMMSAKKGWGETDIPAFELSKASVRAVKKVTEGKFDEGDIKEIAEGIATWMGIPYTQPRRVIKMLKTGEVKELVGGESIEKRKKKRILIPGTK